MSNAELAPNFSIESVASQLNGIKKGDKYSCLCPAHPDTKPSLSVSLSDTGKILFYCHAGCSQQQVLTALRNRGIMPQAKLTQVKDTIEALYEYTDAEGKYLFEKVRFAGKKFLHRKKMDSGAYTYKGVTKDLEIPLYNLVEILNSSSVYIVEGEKDVETLKRHGLVATCNFDGAGKWRDHYNQWLAGKDLIVIGDHDEPGRAHVKMLKVRLSKIAKSLRLVDLALHWPEIKDHGDVSDYLACHKIDDLTQIVISTISEPLPAESTGVKEKKEKVAKVEIPKATYKDYVNLFEEVLGELKVDIFSESMLCCRRGQWTSARNLVGVVRSEAASRSLEMKFDRPLFDDHLDKLESNTEPSLLVDIPAWDGQDRIGLMAKCLVPSPNQDFDSNDFDELLTDWLVKSYRRVFDPNIRNRIIILKGPQHIGKDWWIDSLLYGSGQFLQDLHIGNGDKDCFLQLSSAWYLKISEFDKTARTEVSILKDMITKPFTDLRGPYERDKKRRYSRCSFIAACNIDDILRDSTGSSRYIIFDLAKIEYNYPVRDKLFGAQVMAQAKELASRGFKSNVTTEDKLSEYLEQRTPGDLASEVVELYTAKIGGFIDTLGLMTQSEIRLKGQLSFHQIQPLISDISKILDVRPKAILSILVSQKLSKKIMGNRVYIIPQESNLDGIDGSMEQDEIPF